MVLTVYGMESENRFKHVAPFFKISSAVFLSNVSNDALRLHLWLFSLKDTTKAWSDTKTNVITWDQMQKEFLYKFFFIDKLTTI